MIATKLDTENPTLLDSCIQVTCSQISLIDIQNKNSVKCNLNAINLEINSWKMMKKRVKGTTWKGQMPLPNI